MAQDSLQEASRKLAINYGWAGGDTRSVQNCTPQRSASHDKALATTDKAEPSSESTHDYFPDEYIITARTHLATSEDMLSGPFSGLAIETLAAVVAHVLPWRQERALLRARYGNARNCYTLEGPVRHRASCTEWACPQVLCLPNLLGFPARPWGLSRLVA